VKPPPAAHLAGSVRRVTTVTKSHNVASQQRGTLGQAWAEGKGELATSRHRADSGQRTGNGQFVSRHDLHRSHANNNKTKQKSQLAVHRASSRLFTLPLRVWPRFLAADMRKGPNAYIQHHENTCRTAPREITLLSPRARVSESMRSVAPIFHFALPLSFNRVCCGSHHHQPR
jgi:hypothetical protein